jgi:hypothetical protein
MHSKLDQKKKLKSLLSILDTMDWSKKTISRYCPFKALGFKKKQKHAVLEAHRPGDKCLITFFVLLPVGVEYKIWQKNAQGFFSASLEFYRAETSVRWNGSTCLLLRECRVASCSLLFAQACRLIGLVLTIKNTLCVSRESREKKTKCG